VLDMPLLSKKASDLLSPYVGLTEKNIAACFEKAIEQEALLLIDEADSFLQSRSSAAHSWEITAVNEMLTQMESHPLPFVCTTNLINILDEAAFRRFTLKMKFDYLTPAQLNDACQRLCGIPMNKYIEQVALGDIVVARKMMAMLAQTTKIDAQTLYKHLSAACIVKSGGKQKVGFSMN
jgi:SpoVK/Ycf46/Vps4 family AAA+-type ATPase